MRGIDRVDGRHGRPDAGSGSEKPGIGAGRGRRRNRLKPDVLVLEDRRLLATFSVTTTVDTVDANGNGVMGTFRWAVQQADLATSPSTINFNLGTPATITLAQLLKPVELSNTAEPITIDGPGPALLTIDGGHEGAAIRIDPGVTAAITGLRVTGATQDVNNNNGAISDLGALTISNSTLAGNTATSGLYIKGTATVTDCTVTGNDGYAGAGIFVTGIATITGSTIVNNFGKYDGQGGGICNEGTTTVTDCTISGNSAIGGGGGLFNSGMLTVAGSTIAGNTGGEGGGLYNKAGRAYLSGSTISGGSGFIDGGDLNNQYGAALSLSDCVVSGGSALTGGGLYNAGTATIDQSTISGNTATGSSGGGQGGGIANGPLQAKAVVDITDSTLSGNSAEFGGGGLFNHGTAGLSAVTIAGNFAEQAATLASDGGGVENSGTATLVACTITGNTTTALGGGVYNGGIGADAMTLNDTIIAGNTTTVGGTPSDVAVGGGVNTTYFVSGANDLVGTGGDGGLGSNGTNKINIANPGLAPLADYGGPTQTIALLAGSPAIDAGSKALELDPQGNPLAADQRGFALDTPNPDIGAYQAIAVPLVVQSTGEGAAVPYGELSLRGAVDLANLRAGNVAVTFDPTAFATAQTIVLTEGPLEISNTAAASVTITGPAAGVTVSGDHAGRVFQVDHNVTATIAGLTITQGATAVGGAGTDPGLGGGLLNLGTTTLTDCTISGNSAADGGGLANLFSATLTLSGTTVSGNSARALGGGLYNLGTATVDDSTIGGNTAKTDGGGIYDRTGTVELDGTTVSGNSAVGGAGLFLDGLTTLKASTISGNSGGGGIEVAGASVTLINCTIDGNTSIGLNNQFGTVLMEAGTVTGNSDFGLANYNNSSTGTIELLGTIVAGNALNGTPTDIGGSGAADVTGLSNLIGTGGSGGLTNNVGGNVVGVADPLLSALGNYGGPTQTVALLPGSPAIGAGTAISGVTADARGEPLDSPSPDIGAFQSQGFTLTPVAGSTPQTAAVGGAFTNLLAVAVAANNPSEPVTGGVITFAAPTSGASANLSSSTAVVGPTGRASVGATANADDGSYTVTASAAGAATSASFHLDNLVGLSFSNLTDPTITYGSTTTFTGTISTGGGQAPTGESVTVTVDGASQSGVIGANGSFSVTVNTSGLGASSLNYTVTYSYGGDATYAATAATGTLTVNAATPTVSVVDAGGTYDGSVFAATATVAGVGGTPSGTLEGVPLSIAYYVGTFNNPSLLMGLQTVPAPAGAGAYTVVASFPGSADYSSADALANFSIADATPTVAVFDAGGTYSGGAFAATATVAGVSGTPEPSLESVVPLLTYYAGTYTNPSQLTSVTAVPAPSAAGSYTVLASFPGSNDYGTGTALANFTISQATPTVSVTAPGGTYGSSIAAVSATIAGVSGSAGSTLEGVGLTFTYYSGTYASVSALNGATPLSGAPGHAGSYTVEATFAGSTDYAAASAVSDFDIARAAPVLAVAEAGGTFDGSTFPTTDSVAGVVNGVDNTPGPQLEGVGLTLSYYAGTYTSASQLASLTPLGGSPTGAGSYTVEVGFAGSADYAPGAALANFRIAAATPTVAVVDAGGTYDLSTFPGTATVAGVVNGVDNTPAASLEGVSPALNYYVGTYANAAQLVGVTPLSGGAPSGAGSYTVLASFPGSADYAAGSAVADFAIAQATPAVSVVDAGGTYSGSAFPAAATVAGVNGTPGATLESTSPALSYYSGTFTSVGQLGGHGPLPAVPSHAGSYTVVASFPGTADYAAATALANFSIAQATPQVTWNAPASIVFGTPLSAGQLDASFSGVAGSAAYAPGVGAILGAGGQTLSLTFTPTDTVDYTTAHATTTITITPATPMLSVSAPGGTYDGSPFAASVAIAGSPGAAPAASLENVSPTLTYYAGAGTSGTDLGATPPSAPGTYTVVASFAGSADYTATRSSPLTFAIAPASPAVLLSLSGGTAAYGQAVTITATVTGVSGAPGGTVTFHDGSTTLGTAALDASGHATLTTTALAVGAHSITVSYSGAPGLVAVTSAPAGESVSRAAAQVVLAPQPVFKKKKVIALGLTAEVRSTAAAGAAAPAGTVTFDETFKKGKGKKARTTVKVLGTAALSGGSATLTVKPNSVFKRPIAIVYGGDADFQPGTSASLTLTPSSLKSLARPMLGLQGRGAARLAQPR